MLYFFLLLAGAVVGLFAAFPGRFLTVCGALQNFCLLAVVFTIGVSLGRRPDFTQNILSLGGAGLAFAFASLAGSVLAVFVLKRLFYKRDGDGK